MAAHAKIAELTSLLASKRTRLAARNEELRTQTAGLAPGHLQANMIVLPSRYAADFRALCARNPVPCPLIAESAGRGRYDAVVSCVPGLNGTDILTNECDLRRDISGYMVYVDSKLERTHCADVVPEWTDDHVAFLIGCSYSFESELAVAGLPPRHIVLERNVPMYRTSLPLCPAGVFTGSTYVVSMRPYKRSELERVRNITREYAATHGEPIDWGWDAVKRLGIRDIGSPEWGDAPLGLDGGPFRENADDTDETIPVFWGCGVTPQEAVMRAGLKGTILAHAPGHMLILDAKDEDIKK